MLVQDNTPNINFNGRLPNKVYKNIKEIPNLRCICCDEFMLTGAEKTEFVKKFRLPLKDVLKLPILERFKDSEVFEFLEKLGEKYPKESLFEGLELAEKEPLYRDLNIPVKLELEDVLTEIGPLHVNSAKFIKLMDKFSDRFKGDIKELYEQLRFYSMKYPDETFSEILERPNVRDFHRRSYKHKSEQSFTIRRNVIKNIKTYAEKFDEKDKTLFDRTLDELEGLGSQILRDNLIKKQYYIYKMTTGMNQVSNTRIKQKILKELEKLPEFSLSVDSYLSKPHSDESILECLLHNLEISFDHIHVRSKKGSDKIANGTFMCSYCNNKRSTLSYTFLSHINPKLKGNIKKQINRIKSFIQGDRLTDNDLYPVEVKRNLSNNIKGGIDIDMKGFLKFLDKKTKASTNACKEKLEANKMAINEAQREYEAAIALVNAAKQKRASLKHQKMLLHNELQTSENNARKLQDLIEKETNGTLNNF